MPAPAKPQSPILTIMFWAVGIIRFSITLLRSESSGGIDGETGRGVGGIADTGGHSIVKAVTKTRAFT